MNRGQQGERDAERFLTHLGYRILERNFRCPLGEIDLIAKDGETLCFIEVKSRASDSCGHPAESVHRNKQRKIARVAQYYLAQLASRRVECRFDVVAVFQDAQPELIRDAFRQEFTSGHYSF